MMDFLDSLKEIKKEMIKEQKPKKNLKEPFKEAKKSEENQELTQEFETLFLKEQRLRDEFAEFIKNCDIRKI